jgi:diguanylate cyclase
VYSAARDEHSPRRLMLAAELRGALERGELTVHYQPKIDLRTGGLVGAEALVRWMHPMLGIVPPDEFVAIAERTGLIQPLTTLVLRRSLHQCRVWRRAGERIDVAVNLSAGSLLNRSLPGEVRQLLAEAGIAPGALTLEITESSIMIDPAGAVEVLAALSGMGVQLAVDDFGTGYSSLSHLKGLPVHELKIDRSFVANMASDDNDAVIVRSTVELGHNLGLRVVAEGVEDPETWQRLVALGCDVAQGHHFSRALEPESLLAWGSSWRRSQGSRPAPRPRVPLELVAPSGQLEDSGDGMRLPSTSYS